MALTELTVQEFVEEVVFAMKDFELCKNKRVEVVFRGWSCNAAIEFKKTALMEEVYARVCSIEAMRKNTKDRAKTCSNKPQEGAESLRIITAEIQSVQKKNKV